MRKYTIRWRKKSEGEERPAYTFFTLAVVPITVVALLIARPVLVLMRVEDAAMGEAYLYLMIVSGGLIGTIGYNINSGILQGVGNSRASLLFLGISAVMNIVLDLLFVLQFHWGGGGRGHRHHYLPVLLLDLWRVLYQPQLYRLCHPALLPAL